MDTFRYKYVNSDLLQNYQMSEFEGIKFLKSYQNLRNKILEKIKNKCKKILTINDILNMTVESNPTKIFIITEKILKTCLKNILLLKLNDDDKIIVLKLIKKFEIKKILYTEYTNELKENTDQSDIFLNYLLLSCICLVLYDQEKNLSFLNTSLKINDIMISQFNLITDSDELSMLYYNLKKELEYVKSVAMMKKIEIL